MVVNQLQGGVEIRHTHYAENRAKDFILVNTHFSGNLVEQAAAEIETVFMVIDAQAASRFETGTRVFHQKFGYGLVTEIEGDKLTVAFEKAGEKKVVASYVAEAKKPGAADDVPF